MKFELDHNVNHIHLIGIGGISMSGIAEILLKEGFQVSGSDVAATPITERLKAKGARIDFGHHGTLVEDADLIVYSAAIKGDNPERVLGQKSNIPEIDRAKMLGKIMKSYPYAIAIAGSHGKTTTTSFISLLLEYSDLDPTIMVGGNLAEIGGNIKIGNSDYFVTEACEYYESFLQFQPKIGVLLNIDKDHLDYFQDMDHIIRAFKGFAELVPPEGHLIAFNDNEHIRGILPDIHCQKVTYGLREDSDFTAENVVYNDLAHPSFDLYYQGKNLGPITLQIPGMHNVYNALAAIATAFVLGIPLEDIQKNITRFKGIHRRFDVLGKVKGATIVDDYAHHPAEIEATLEAVRNYKHRKVWCVFQPHTFSRTKALLDDFSKAFALADHVILADIYAAREKDDGVVSSESLLALMENHPDTYYLKSFEEIRDFLYPRIQAEDIVLTMGAGDVYRIGEMLLDLNNRK
ncbi:UDP-N-acetylmuramate--L-alanine ligase [Isachenkonia alkalipeptolytica]|uniref:UDP-N-acetylmuramate--L-alanine ligase n=1 Tax=Isachenkonia alkalipeptolytica TaxID=2565777 RepID=A0AA43XLP2_9CLOT|nr:UDP-N-acetylmuramate--L-alanine ligase [Isachenkonia alkalipeptolytica]NBG89065.1 UDP-N-acetylmuramate--L-alanine ligase [Isachenkonia alkalipeptolytica]